MSWPPYLPSESDLLVNVSVRIQFRKQKPLSVLSDTLIKCQDLAVSQIIGRPGGRASALPVTPPLEHKTLARLQFVGEAASTAATPAIGEWLLHTLGVDSGHCPLTPRKLESGHWNSMVQNFHGLVASLVSVFQISSKCMWICRIQFISSILVAWGTGKCDF